MRVRSGDAVAEPTELNAVPVPQAGALPRIGVIETLEDAEPVWRRLENEGHATAYQRFDWCAARLAALPAPHAVRIAVIGHPGAPLALLPLAVEKRFGVRHGRVLASEIGNADSLILGAEGLERLTPETVRALIPAIGKAAGLDTLTLRNIAPEREGWREPLAALERMPSASRLYRSHIGGTAIPFIDNGLTNKLRANIRRGMRRIEEMTGPVKLVRVTDPALFARVHAEFNAQRDERFAQMGLDNPFATPEMRALFDELARRGLTGKNPFFLVHALMAGGEILATSFGLRAGSHFSQYINSTSLGPASKYSLMGILIGLMLDDLLADGIVSFDMGVGDFAYKTDWTEPVEVYDALVPVTARGELVLQFEGAALFAKRVIKQTPALWSMAQRLRRGLYGLRRR
jgi:CelD/BcsL family acetyltransferase involved in cellulose biosynthesis